PAYAEKRTKSSCGFLLPRSDNGSDVLFYQAKILQKRIYHWANHCLPMQEQMLSLQEGTLLQCRFLRRHASIKIPDRKLPAFPHRKSTQPSDLILFSEGLFPPFDARCAYGGSSSG